jgi:hypothetical protein
MCFFRPKREESGIRTIAPAAISPAPAFTPPPAATAPPTPSSPSPTVSGPQPRNIEAQRRRKIAAVRYGMLSTIKTSPLGIAGAGESRNRAKTTLGA